VRTRLSLKTRTIRHSGKDFVLCQNRRTCWFSDSATGDIESFGGKIAAPGGLLGLFESFSIRRLKPGGRYADHKPSGLPLPAREVLVVYASGLGRPATLFQTVSGTPAGGVAVNRHFTVSFTGGVSQPAASPDYAGLFGAMLDCTRSIFAPSCPGISAALPAVAKLVEAASGNPSNSTMTPAGTSSLDQALCCVQP